MRPRFAPAPLALALALMASPGVQSATRSWACTVGYWDYEDCWSPFGLPAPTDDAQAAAVNGMDTFLRFDNVTGHRVVSRLTVNTALGGAGVSFEQSGGSLSTRDTTVGGTGKGSFLQTGGLHSVSSSLVVHSPTGEALYRLEGGSLTTRTSFVGLSGAGRFEQTGGTHNSQEVLLTGDGSRYLMRGGTLQAAAALSVGSGARYYHEAGTVNVPYLAVGRADGVGDYLMKSAGAASAGVLNADAVQVGYGGFMVLEGAAAVAAQTLRVGDGDGYSEFFLNGGTVVATSMVVGGGADGSLSHGYNSSTQLVQLVIGEQAGVHGELSMQGDGTLTSSVVLVGQQGTARVLHTGGVIRVTDTMTTGQGGVYSLSLDGRLEAAGSARVINHGSFNHVGGRFVGTLENHGQFLLDDQSIPGYGGIAPDFAGHLINHGSVTLTGNATFGDGLRNEASLDLLPTGRTLTLNGQGLYNNGSMVLAGGTLQGNAAIVNVGDMAGHGRIAGWEIDNFGTVVQRHGTLALAPSSGAVFNYGRWDLDAGRELKLDGSAVVFHNLGAMALAGGRVGGSGQLLNSGVLSGSGHIQTRFHNSGSMVIAAAEWVTVSGGFASDGQIDLRGGSAALVSGPLANQGLVLGSGRVTAPVDNQAGGRIVAQGGVLTLGDKVSNAGLLAADAGGTLVLQRALLAQTGTLQMAGGTIDTHGQHLRNDGVITGWGALRATTLDNAGRMLFGAGNTQVFGSVDHLAGAQIVVSGTGVAHFHGTVQARAGSELRVSADSAAVFFASVSQASGAAFTGEGTSYFEGGLSVGNSPGSGGAQGSVVFGSGNLYRAEIGGLAPGSGFDHFVVGEHLSLGGTLQLSWWSGFEGQVGQRFDLFDWGSLSGNFASIDLTAAALAPGLRWDTSHLYLDGSMSVTAVPEPQTWALMLAGLVVATGAAARRGATLGR